MQINRDRSLDKLTALQWNGQIKVVTGLRRVGKSYLLQPLFRERLLARGVRPEHILSYALDAAEDIRFRNPLELAAAVRSIVAGREERFYLFVDEIQMSDQVPNPHNPDGKTITFADALNDLKRLPNLDIYVTGSNSRLLSTDVLTEFRGRGDEIRLHPLTFAEYFAAWSAASPSGTGAERTTAFEEYALYGGLPLIRSRPDASARMAYLNALFSEVYLKDIVQRHEIARPALLAAIVDLLASSVGSLCNPPAVARALNSRQKLSGPDRVSVETVAAYMGHLEDAFLFRACRRYDVKGRAYFDAPNKYYCEDLGLRNARTGFRQQEMPHIMENIVHNELVARGYAVDVGVVYDEPGGKNGKNGRNGKPGKPGKKSDGVTGAARPAREIDFVATLGGKRVYIQSAFAMSSPDKARAETRPFALTGDFFPKIVVRGDTLGRWYDDQGILHIGILDFLLNHDPL